MAGICVSNCLAALTAWLLLGSAMPPRVDDPQNPQCDGEIYVLDPAQALRCINLGCDPGCAKMVVQLASGQGRICVCNYVGPQPMCCTLCVTDTGQKTTYGTCGTSGCPEGNTCFMGTVEHTSIIHAYCITLP